MTFFWRPFDGAVSLQFRIREFHMRAFLPVEALPHLANHIKTEPRIRSHVLAIYEWMKQVKSEKAKTLARTRRKKAKHEN